MEVYEVEQRASRRIYVEAVSRDEAIHTARMMGLFSEVDWDTWNTEAVIVPESDIDPNELVWDGDNWRDPHAD